MVVCTLLFSSITPLHTGMNDKFNVEPAEFGSDFKNTRFPSESTRTCGALYIMPRVVAPLLTRILTSSTFTKLDFVTRVNSNSPPSKATPKISSISASFIVYLSSF